MDTSAFVGLTIPPSILLLLVGLLIGLLATHKRR